ncbi:hypothetical protein KC340_g166 [Hortaea werneckii]|nr:hypothetical protein KC340_g166 [Hortaea werneckii]
MPSCLPTWTYPPESLLPRQILERCLLTFNPQSLLPLKPSRVSSKPNTTPIALQNRNPALTTSKYIRIAANRICEQPT